MKYKIWFCSNHVFSNKEKRLLFEHYRDFHRIYKASEKELIELPFLRKENIKVFCETRSSFDLNSYYKYVLEEDIRCICLFDEDYPKKLKHIHDIPFQIFYKGQMPDESERIISIVGARRCTGYGKSYTSEISELLVKNGLSVMSGMASGIDTYAHEGALKGKGRTFAILGCGVDVCYPTKNLGLYHEIIKNGGILSEYGPKTPPQAELFPRRNRIISGLCDVLLVMEAKERSGSLITAQFALEQGKDIFALPGRICDSLSKGTNDLIAQGAGIITSPKQLISDICETKNWEYQPVVFSEKGKFNLEKEQLLVYSCFDFNSKSIDEVVAETGLDIMTVLQNIMDLCDLGLIEESFMNQYIKI